jgi:hypothetical protein
MNRLRISQPALLPLARRIADERRIVMARLGECRLEEGREWLYQPSPGMPAATDPTARLLAIGSADAAQLTAALERALARSPEGAECVLLALGVGPAAGRVAGLVRSAQGLLPLDRLDLVGPELPAVALSPEAQVRRLLASIHTIAEPSALDIENPVTAADPETLWSRTIGALGEAAWHRLTELETLIIGVGRTGSLLAEALVRVGVRSLTLLDPDTLESGNVGEMAAMRPADIGRAKVEAVAAAMLARAPYPDLRLTPLPVSVLAYSALAAVKRADLVCCCVDNPAARILAQLLSTLYLRPLLDIGTGIFLERAGSGGVGQAPAGTPPLRRMGADIRLMLPGHCLRCCGGIADFEAGRRQLLAGPTAVGPQSDWRLQRAGSLHALNSVAVGLGVTLLTDLVAGRLRGATWLRLEVADDGTPRLERSSPPANSACALCGLSAQGDAALDRLSAVLDTL